MVIAPPPNATPVSHTAARSARSCVRDLACCASRTSFITWDKKESAPVFSTTTVIDPSPFTEPPMTRSEEHTSELQSRPHLVCRLLLEKKKNKNNIEIIIKIT